MTEGSFRDAYGVLQQHAKTLRDQAEQNIDDLLAIATESVEADKVCKGRIDAGEAELKVALDGTGVGAPGQLADSREKGLLTPQSPEDFVVQSCTARGTTASRT